MRELYLLTHSESAWMDDAECARSEPEVFLFGGDAAALALCDRCRVRQACLEYAVENDERFGIWGGTTAAQRRRGVGQNVGQ